jgi:hypothetical protein
MLTEYTIKSTLSSILFDNVLCESIHEKHLVNYFYEELMLEKLLVGEPITVPELRKLLHQKIVNFEFIKLNGNIRPARGTTVMDKIPASDHPKGVRPSSKKVATFWDLSKKAWRSVSSRSKEIVLKKNDDDKAIVTVRDKKDNEPNQVIVKKKEEPIKKEPEIKEKPKKEEEPKEEKPTTKKVEEPKDVEIEEPVTVTDTNVESPAPEPAPKAPIKKETPIKKEVPIKKEPAPPPTPIKKTPGPAPKTAAPEPELAKPINPAAQPEVKKPGDEPEINTFAPEEE